MSCDGCLFKDICKTDAFIADLNIPMDSLNGEDILNDDSENNNSELKPWVESGKFFYCPHCWNSFTNTYLYCPRCSEELDFYHSIVLKPYASCREEHGKFICIGVKEPEECSCKGDRLACPLYESIRESAKKSVAEGIESFHKEELKE